MVVNTNEESPKDDKEEGGKTEKDLFDIDGLVDQGEHTVVEDNRDAVVEEGLTENKEVEAGVHLLISILNLRQLDNKYNWLNTFISSNIAKTATGSTADIKLAKSRA